MKAGYEGRLQRGEYIEDNIKASIRVNIRMTSGVYWCRYEREGEREEGEVYSRWLREHPQIRLYLKSEEYVWLKRIVDEKKTSMKNILLEALRNAREAYRQGMNDLLDAFIDNPYAFYGALMIRARKGRLTGFMIFPGSKIKAYKPLQ